MSVAGFGEFAQRYYDAGFYPIPVPDRQKKPPLKGTTGRRAPYPDQEQIDEWRDEYARWNIAIRLGDGHLILDVDDYEDKHGLETLAELEERLGPLPETWITGARGFGQGGGHRHFRVPTGYHWRGKAGPGIDVIQSGHRFCMVPPSIHPSAGEYVSTGDIPDFEDLPELPSSWVDYLTQGEIRDRGEELMDMDSTDDEIMEWTLGLHGDPGGEYGTGELDQDCCAEMKRMVGYWQKAIVDDESSHDKVMEAHWNLIRLAAEGHQGWLTAVQAVEAHWLENVWQRGKRGLDEGRSEVYRSRMGALRKIKGVENGRPGNDDLGIEEISGEIFVNKCTCFGGAGGKNYTMTDDGNGEMFADYYGENMVYDVRTDTWMFWNEKTKLWYRSDPMRHYRRIVPFLWEDQARELSEKGMALGDEGLELLAAAKAIYVHVRNSRSTPKMASAVAATKAHLPEVPINFDENGEILNTPDGVIELRTATLRPVEKSDYIAKQTTARYAPLEMWQLTEKKGGDSDMRAAWELFEHEVLDRFLPDLELRAAFQQILGYALVGGNLDKKVFLIKGESNTGKSTILELINKALSDYSGVVSVYAWQPNSQFNPELMNTIGCRWIYSNEVNTGIMNSALIKTITGQDEQSFQVKNSNYPFVAKPQFTPVWAVNDWPDFKDIDDALRNRIIAFPFDNVIAESDRSNQVAKAVMNLCVDVFFAWAMEGTKATFGSGEGPDYSLVSLEEAKTEFHAATASIEDLWFGECIWVTGDPQDYLANKTLQNSYEQWCNVNNVHERHRKNQTALGKYISSRKVPPTLGRHDEGGKVQRGRKGVKLLPLNIY